MSKTKSVELAREGGTWPHEVVEVDPDEALDADTPRETMVRVAETAPGTAAKLVRVSKDVYEEFYFPDTKRPSTRLVAHAGETMTEEQAEARGLKSSDFSKVDPEAEARAAAEERPGSIGVNTAPEAYDPLKGGVGIGADLHDVEGQPYDAGTAAAATLNEDGQETDYPVDTTVAVLEQLPEDPTIETVGGVEAGPDPTEPRPKSKSAKNKADKPAEEAAE